MKGKEVAYIKTDGMTFPGPYPAHAGEYCGNHMPGWPARPCTGQTQKEADESQRAWLAKMRFGVPQSCKTFTSEEGKLRGYVGLYLRESRELYDWEQAVLTPPELMEPGFEHLYNIDRKPGRS